MYSFQFENENSHDLQRDYLFVPWKSQSIYFICVILRLLYVFFSNLSFPGCAQGIFGVKTTPAPPQFGSLQPTGPREC